MIPISHFPQEETENFSPRVETESSGCGNWKINYCLQCYRHSGCTVEIVEDNYLFIALFGAEHSQVSFPGAKRNVCSQVWSCKAPSKMALVVLERGKVLPLLHPREEVPQERKICLNQQRTTSCHEPLSNFCHYSSKGDLLHCGQMLRKHCNGRLRF